MIDLVEIVGGLVVGRSWVGMALGCFPWIHVFMGGICGLFARAYGFACLVCLSASAAFAVAFEG